MRKLPIILALILFFNVNFGAYKTASVSASTVAAKFDEFAAASYAAVVTGTMTVATGAMHAEQYLKNNVDAMYQTAKETWPKLSADMQQNFIQSLNTMGDGVIQVGDWITAGLDALKAKFGAKEFETVPSDGAGRSKIINLGVTTKISIVYPHMDPDSYYLNTLQLTASYNTDMSASLCINGSYACNNVIYGNYGFTSLTDYRAYIANLSSVAGFINAYAMTKYVLDVGGVVNTDTTYNRIDQWLRDTMPSGNLGVYTPAEAWTKGDGIPQRLGLDTTGQNLLTLPDGIPWQGDYGYVIPRTQLIDGVPAVLDTTVADWVGIKDRVKIRDATADDIAQALDVDLAIAQEILDRIKKSEDTKPKDDKYKDKSNRWGKLITTKFPFSLPWDLYFVLAFLAASPATPKWTVDTSVADMPIKFEINFSFLDPYIGFFRGFIILGFAYMLIMSTRKLLGGAQ